MALAIKVENLSKAYQLGEIGTGTLSRDLERWFAKLRGKEDPYLKIGETNDRTSKGNSDIVWSLKNVNFEIQQGDAVGIIGRNGAGKSTLLKILSRVTSPTSGEINVKGRIASLLEVGTGFHPELTGRENILLNGAILGMRKKEILRKFDEIVDFSGVERYIDTPVKRYSSGMYVRLAFAIAAHLESEILIVDEVLAVGDAEFQKKCLGKMGDVSKGEGRTVLFVSHNLEAVETLCKSGILLNQGAVLGKGVTKKVIELYTSLGNENASMELSRSFQKNKSSFQILNLFITDEENNLSINPLDPFKEYFLNLKVYTQYELDKVHLSYDIQNSRDLKIVRSDITDYAKEIPHLKSGFNIIKVPLHIQFLSTGDYFLNFDFGDLITYENDHKERILKFRVQNAYLMKPDNRGILQDILKWKITNV